MEHDRAASRRRVAQIAEMGYPGLLVPEAQGGQGLGPIELAVVCEEAGRACLPGPLFDVQLAAATLAAAGGQDALLARDRGRREDRHDRVAELAVRRGSQADDALRARRVKGRKYFVPFARAADALLVTTAEGIALVEGPFDVTPLDTIDLAQRFGEVALDHPATLIGSTSAPRADRSPRRGGRGATLLGVMADRSRSRSATCRRARPSSGRSARSRRSSTAWPTCCSAPSRRARPSTGGLVPRRERPENGARVRDGEGLRGRRARLVCAETIQMHGGIGFTWELDVHFYFKRAKTYEMHYGSTEGAARRVLRGGRRLARRTSRPARHCGRPRILVLDRLLEGEIRDADVSRSTCP
jgi:hypothetical protein